MGIGGGIQRKFGFGPDATMKREVSWGVGSMCMQYLCDV
jgi:hypothetical protein